jgi:hypothetical protein
LLNSSSPVACRNSALTGSAYFKELMETNSTARFREVARMDKRTFISLLSKLTNEGNLKSTSRIGPGEKLMLFLFVLTRNSNRSAAERWQHSGSTVSIIVHDVIDSIMRVRNCFCCIPDPDIVQSKILNDPKFYPYFSNCIGALDGTHIPAVVSALDQKPFRNRKGFISQNVLAVVNFDMTFSYILAGWEGSAHDGRVLNDALTKGLHLFPSKFYLGDAGYALTPYCLTPYRGTRYHLKEWKAGNLRPQNKEELFNLRHSSLRNVIERVFGVVKKRFPILVTMPSYPYSTQISLVLCALYIHNFIRLNQVYEDDYDEFDDDEVDVDDTMNPPLNEFESQDVNSWRDSIAQSMWDDYISNHRRIY